MEDGEREPGPKINKINDFAVSHGFPPGEDVISLALNEADTFEVVLNITSGEKEAEINRMTQKKHID